MTGRSAETLGALAALGAALTWAVTSLMVRTLIPRYSAIAIGALRSCVGGAVLVAVVLLWRGVEAFTSISAANLALLAVSIVAAIAIGDTAFFESTRRLGLARGMSLSMTYPLVAALLAALLGERITARIVVGTLLTLGGVALILAPRDEADAPAPAPVGAAGGWWAGVAAALVASVAWGVSAVLMKAPLREVDAVTAQAVRLPIAGALLCLTPWTRAAVVRLRTGDRAALRTIAILGALTTVSSVLFVAGLKYAGVAVGAVLSSTAPVFAIPLGLVFLGERLAAAPIAGAIVAVAGIAVLQL